MLALVAALLVFAGLIGFGLRLVRWLGVPPELPEGPQFEPPAPAIADVLAPAEARARAERQLRLRAIGDDARAAAVAALSCAEAALLPLPAAERAEIRAHADAARAAATAAEKGWKEADGATVAMHAAAAARAKAAVEAVLARVPETGRWRRLIFVCAVMVALFALVQISIVLAAR